MLTWGCDTVSGLADFTIEPVTTAGGAGGTGGAGGAGGAGPNVLFSAVFGEVGVTTGLAVAVNSRDEVIVAGTTSQNVDLGGGTLLAGEPPDIVLARLDAQGTHLKSRLFGGLGAQNVLDIAITAGDDILIVGQAQNELTLDQTPVLMGAVFGFVVKLDGETLDVRWAQALPGEVVVSTTDVGPDGSIYLGGRYEGLVGLLDGATASDGMDGFVTKLASDGSHIRTLRMSQPGVQRVDRVAATDDEGLVIGARFEGTLDLGAGPLISDGVDALLAKLDTGGTPLWQYAITGASSERLRGLTTSESGKIGVLGSFNGTVVLDAESFAAEAANVFMLTLDDQGATVSFDWGRAIPGTDDGQFLRSPICFDADGNMLLAGAIVADADFGGGNVLSASNDTRDVMVAKLSPAGAHIRSDAWGGALGDWASAIAVDSAGNSWVVGSFQGSIDFNVGYTVASTRSMFVLKLAP